MKKIIVSIVILLLAFRVGAQGQYEFSGGTGTADDPYLITTVEDLDAVRDFLRSNYHFRLYSDIDLTGYIASTGWAPIGRYNETNDLTSSSDTIYSFNGTFNGGGKTIKGLWIGDGEEVSVCNGLFGYSNGTIKNLSVELSSDKPILGDTISGGIVGWNDGNIDSCLVVGGTVTADTIAGGIAGMNTGTITYCISTAAVQGSEEDDSEDAGVLVGYNAGGGTITSSYYLSADEGPTAVGNAADDITHTKAATLTALKLKDTYSWDFKDTWCIEEGATFPRLQNYVFYAGDGSEDSPYEIYSPDDLAALRLFLGTDYNDYHFILGNDIELSGNWIAIGKDDVKYTFNGSFDGAGYTISGLKIAAPTLLDQGLFGTTGNTNAVFQNIQLELAEVGIIGSGRTGALIGYSKATIKNCKVTGGKVQGGNYVGGLIGWQNGGSITSSVAKTDVVGDAFVGGLVGRADEGCIISQSFAQGTVIGSTGTAGGLVGTLKGSIEYCYATGDVTYGSHAGGLAGYLVMGSSITNSYAYGKVSGATTNNGIAEGTGITSSYFKKDTDWNTNVLGDGGKSAAEMKTAETFDGWFSADPPVWKIIEGFSYPYLLDEEILMDGGTATDPILIPTEAALANVGYFVGESYADMHFKVTADIPLTKSWSSIGHTLLPFEGKFDGNSHIISGLSINNTAANQGLFGYIGTEGEVKGLTVQVHTNGIIGGDNFGALAGTNEGLIEKCRVIGTGLVSGTANVGGVAGYNTGTIKETFSVVPVEATRVNSIAGGLVGVTSGTLSHTYATGDVAANYTGGLAGAQYGGTITYSYATGAVSGTYAGGLVGTRSDGSISNAFFDTWTTGKSLAVGEGTAYSSGTKTTLDLLTASTFDAWKTQNTNWTFSYGEGEDATAVYPYFSWQKGTVANKLSDVFALTNYTYSYGGASSDDVPDERPLSVYGKATAITLSATASEGVQKRIVSPTLAEVGKTYYGVFLGTSQSGITRPDTLSIVRDLTTYTVQLTQPDLDAIVLTGTLTFGQDSVIAKDDTFTFAFRLAEGYEKYFVEVSSGTGEAKNVLEPVSIKDGLHTYAFTVTCDSVLNFALTPGYAVTIEAPEEGITFISGDTVNIVMVDSAFTFRFAYAEGYSASTHALAVTTGETILEPDLDEGVYSFTLDKVESDTTVTISLTFIDYVTVTINAQEGVILENVKRTNEVVQGEHFSFYVILDDSYDFSNHTMRATVEETPLTLSMQDGKYFVDLGEVNEDVDVAINMIPKEEQVDPIYQTVTIEVNQANGIVLETGIAYSNQVVKGEEFVLQFTLAEAFKSYGVEVRTFTNRLIHQLSEGVYSVTISAIDTDLAIYVLLSEPEPEVKDPVYHTVTINAALGIKLQGTLPICQAIEGKPFSFQFTVDERYMSGKTVFVKAGSAQHYPLLEDGVYTVTISRITGNLSIQVSLVEEVFSEDMFKVNIVFPLGIELLSGSHSMDVADGKSCTFSFRLFPDYTHLAPVVKSGDITLKPTLDGGVYTVVISQVRANMTFEVTLEDGVSNEKLNDQLQITPGTGCLMIGSPQRVPVYIYEVSGRMVAQREIEGEEIITLPAGFYIVRSNTTVKKVMVR
ncbi:T9SS type A sorting domain-containing protein [Parabacteroides sp. PFB2-10]|uniref:T9SS type A sorting domain-containing protein n=1 Tax=Parabacteroides sp. PFB2-10 TaxID=1742405 RepID=UPI002474DDDC|nr:T9SS type A sorting domain-containing protein [Parabacteroides sp. PFB2-10]